MKTALQFDRASLNINDSARDGLIFDLQNAADCLDKFGSSLTHLRSVASHLVESNVWNETELAGLLTTDSTDVHAYHGALRRSLQQKF